MLEILVSCAIGYFIGYLLAYRFRKPAGTLKIDQSNPGKDLYRFEIDDLEGLSKKKRIVLKVDNDADLSQK